jgi:hypothetical protein
MRVSLTESIKIIKYLLYLKNIIGLKKRTLYRTGGENKNHKLN